MGTITIPNTFTSGTTIQSSPVNANFTTIATEINGNLDSDNLADGAVTNAKVAAGISPAKLDGYGAFHAQNTAGQSLTASYATFEFANEVFDKDSAFDAVTNYQYTAPAAGIYHLHVYIFQTATAVGVAPYLKLVKDPDGTPSTIQEVSSLLDTSCSNLCIDVLVQLAASDVVEAQAKCNGTTYKGYFCGRLVSADS